MYQHDTELTEKYARGNPGTIAKARKNLTIHILVYRFRCPQCGAKFSIPKDSFTGRNIAAGEHPSCNDCALHRVRNNGNLKEEEKRENSEDGVFSFPDLIDNSPVAYPRVSLPAIISSSLEMRGLRGATASWSILSRMRVAVFPRHS